MSNIQSNAKFGEYQLGQNHQIEQLWLKYHALEQGKWIMGIDRVIKLHEYLKELQPKHILELGTGIGCSTEIMAFTCPESSIYTIEQNQKCIDIAKKMIPDSLKERIYFKHSKVAVLKPIYHVNPYVSFSAYVSPFDRMNYDFIFIDGPGPFKALSKDHNGETWEVLADLPGGDLIDLLSKSNEGTIFYIDGRKQMVNLYLRHLLHYLEVIENGPKHTIFKRNERPLSPDLFDFMNSDMTFKYLKDNKYFDEQI